MNRAHKFISYIILRPGLIVIAVLSLTSCAHTLKWTPETVSPPSSLENALKNVEKSVKDSRAALNTDGEEPVGLSRDGAILTALARNRALAVEQFSPDITVTQINDSRAVFDPGLLSTASYGKSTRISSAEGDEDSEVSTTNTFQSDVNVSKSFPTGTEIFLSGAVSSSDNSESDREYDSSWSFGVNQSLLQGAGSEVNLISLRQAENNSAISMHELRGYINDLVVQVEDAYWELVLAEETLKIREFAVELAEEQLDLNNDLISVGKLSEDSAVTARAEVASSKADLVDAEADVQSRTLELIRLLNPESSSQWNLTFDTQDAPEVEHVNTDPDISAGLAELYHPDLAQARLQLANRELDVIQTKNGLLPVLDATASYGRSGSGDSFGDSMDYLNDGDNDNYSIGLSFQMNPLNRSEKAAYQRAQLYQEQAEASVKNMEQMLEAEARGAVIEVRKQWEKIAAARELVKSREEELAVEQARFRVGKSTNLDVLQVHRDLIQAQVDEVTARVRYIESLTALYKAEGTLLDRRGVGMETS